ncbi:MAG: type II secretion system F family protein [Acidimicrobiales bacterium]
MKAVWLAAVAVILAVFALAPAGSAQSADAPLLQVREVNSLDPTANTATFFSSGGTSGASFSLNGDPLTPTSITALPTARSMGNVLVFDTSTDMDKSGALAAAKDQARKWIAARTGDRTLTQQFAVVVTSDGGKVIQGLTASPVLLNEALDNVGPSTEEAERDKSALWSAIRQGAAALSKNSSLQPNLIVMAGRNDNASGNDRQAAIGEIASARASVFGLAYTGSGYDGGQIKALVDTYGGQYLSTGEGTQFASVVSGASSTIDTQQYVVTYPSSVATGTVANLAITVNGQTGGAAYSSGSAIAGYQNLNPDVQSSNAKGVSFLQGGLGLALAVVLVLVATALAAYAIFLLITKDNSLNNVLQPYSEGYGPQGELESENDGSFAKTALIQRAVEVTENFAESQGYLARAEGALERANLPLRAGEALFFYAAVVLIATILGLALGGLFTALLLGGFAALVPPAAVSFLANKRRKKFLAQLPDTLQLLSGTLRAGYSLMQGVEAVSQEVENPMGQELRRVVTESRLGRPLEESLDGVAERMASPDFAWAVMAIRIQREVGGNLSELLLTVADTMTQRERLRRDVAALTAEGRMSAIVLGLLPIGLGLAMFTINREYTSKLFTDTLGNILLGGAVVMMIIGFVWMKKIIDIEI